ncbi:MAG: hypothetical protein AB1428_07520 [Bacteroidota bacterium]
MRSRKYPPSLLYLLMTIGPGIALLPALDYARGALARPFIVFGRVPLSCYVLHIPLIHMLAMAFAAVSFGRVDFLLSGGLPGFWPEGYGTSLLWVYGIWALVVVTLYAPCRWFADLKRRKKSTLLSYL